MAASRTTARLTRRRPGGGLRALGLAATSAALVLLTGVVPGSAPAHAAEPTDWSVIGHRGLPGSGHTEDTLPSLRAAVRAGATDRAREPE